MNMSRPFIERPVATTLLMAALLLVGIAAFPFLPVAPLPQIDFPTILVSVNLPGASPEIMASSVAQPLERQFAQIPGIAQMTSTSYLGTASITIQFDLNRNIDGAANDVLAGINGAGGQTGSARVANAPADGYMFVLGTVGTHAQGQTLYKQPLYNAATDFTPVILIAEVPLVL